MKNSLKTRDEASQYISERVSSLTSIECFKALVQNAKSGNESKKNRIIKVVVPFVKRGNMSFYKTEDLDKLIKEMTQLNASTFTSSGEIVTAASETNAPFYGVKLGEYFVNPIADNAANESDEVPKIQMHIDNFGTKGLLALKLSEARFLARELNDAIKCLDSDFEPFTTHKPMRKIVI